MILDTSAVVAVFLKEPGYEKLMDKLVSAGTSGMGTPTLAETGVVLTARIGFDSRSLLARFIQEFEIITIPFGDLHWVMAVGAYQRYGKGRNAAALNFGDCLTYATAKLAQQPLLYTGVDFAQTDLKTA